MKRGDFFSLDDRAEEKTDLLCRKEIRAMILSHFELSDGDQRREEDSCQPRSAVNNHHSSLTRPHACSHTLTVLIHMHVHFPHWEEVPVTGARS